MDDLRANLAGVDFADIGVVTASDTMRILGGEKTIAEIPIEELVHAFKHPLDLDHTMTEGGSH